MPFSISTPTFKFGKLFKFGSDGPSPQPLPAPEHLNWDYDSRFTNGSDDNIIRFVDQGPEGINAIKVGGSNAVKLSTVIGAQPVIESPGDLVWSQPSGQYWDPAAAYSGLFVGKIIQSSPPYYVLSNVQGPATKDMAVFLFPFGGTTHFTIFNGTLNPEAVHFDISTAYMNNFAVSFTYNGSGFSTLANWDIRLNGVSQTLTYESSVSGGLNPANYFNTGSSTDPSSQIARILSYNIYLDPSQMDQLSLYVNQTYGL